MKRNHRIAVVGAGVGGLAAAARLQSQGYQVTVFEKNATPGGRCGRLSVPSPSGDGAFQFDIGPTILLMPEVLEETFASFGKKASDYLELIKCDPNYRVHYRDGSSIEFSTDLVRMQAELERVEPGAFTRYLHFLATGKNQYDTSVRDFVGRNFDSVFEMFTPSNLKKVFEIKALKSMYADVGRSFKDERLREALTFQTMYLGISPYEAPAVYELLPYTELAIGIWFPKGGLYAVPKALERAGRELGVTYHYKKTVKEVIVTNGQAKGLQFADGSRFDCDAVLLNADLPWAYKNLLKNTPAQLPKVESLKYTSSAYMMYLGMKRKVPGLQHHNVIFGNDYRGAFKSIFEDFKVPEDPAFYVNAPAHTDPSLAPEGKDALYVLVPTPHKHPSLDWRVEGPKVRAKVFARLEELGFGNLEQDVEVERTMTPDDWEGHFSLERGAAFGLSHNFMQVGPFRPANVDPNVNNLFFVGASTQPGTGVPMVMLSAKLVTERVNQWAEHAAPAATSTPAPVAEVKAA
ncbi:MAG: phytoene desaturase family protein [Myxococcota bacterium]